MSGKHSTRLRILHTNDIHSRFEHMPAIASLIHKLRSEAGEECTLTLDIGDHIDRVRPETEGTLGRANVAVMNATGYDAVTIGNNEGLTYTPDVLYELYSRHASFTVVLGNMPESASGRHASWAMPWHIVEKAGMRVALIGVTACFPDFYGLLGWDVQDPFEAARLLVQQVRDQADIVVILSHLGLRSDERLAAEIAGIDLILGGHTHHLLEQPVRIGDTVICAAGKFGQYVGVVDIVWDSEQRRCTAIEAGVVPVPEAPKDEAVQRLIERYEVEAMESLGRPLAVLCEELPVDWYGESRLGNLLAAGLRRFTGAEIGLVNAGQLLHGLPPGPLTGGALLGLCPSPINPCLVRLTGAQLLRALEESLLPEFMDKPLYGFGFRGKVLGALCVDGMHIEYDPHGEPYRKIRSAHVGSTPLSAQQSYSVGTIDMFTFGIGYLSLGEGADAEYFLPDFIRDVLLRELRRDEALSDSARPRFIKVF